MPHSRIQGVGLEPTSRGHELSRVTITPPIDPFLISVDKRDFYLKIRNQGFPCVAMRGLEPYTLKSVQILNLMCLPVLTTRVLFFKPRSDLHRHFLSYQADTLLLKLRGIILFFFFTSAIGFRTDILQRDKLIF